MTAKLSRLLLRSTAFVDSVKVLVASGAGGDGVSIMAHEHGNEFAGPGGGNGGNGGNVFLRCVSNRYDLSHIAKMGSQVTAAAGNSGFARQAHGKRGQDMWLLLPLGSQVTDVDTNSVLFDMDEVGMEVMLLEGGQGGKGNAAFANKWQHSPIESTRGLPGNTLLAHFELKTIADCGLIGFPNAGKSSLLCAVSSSKPAVAPYAFTTLRPFVGVLQTLSGSRCRIADLPGLIDGAYENRGLGHQFLRHVERSKTIAYVIDMNETYLPGGDADVPMEPWDAFDRLRDELEFYSPELSQRAIMVLANKMDIKVDSRGRSLMEKLQHFQDYVKPLPVFPISAALGTGLSPAMEYLTSAVFERNEEEVKTRAIESRDQQEELRRLFELKHNGVFRQADGAAVREEEESDQGSLVDQQLGFAGDSGFGRKDGAYEHSIAYRRLHSYRDWSMRRESRTVAPR